VLKNVHLKLFTVFISSHGWYIVMKIQKI